MSDAVDEFYATDLMRASTSNPLRERMREFVDEHRPEDDWKTVRTDVASGDDLSELVADGREERV